MFLLFLSSVEVISLLLGREQIMCSHQHKYFIRRCKIIILQLIWELSRSAASSGKGVSEMLSWKQCAACSKNIFWWNYWPSTCVWCWLFFGIFFNFLRQIYVLLTQFLRNLCSPFLAAPQNWNLPRIMFRSLASAGNSLVGPFFHILPQHTGPQPWLLHSRILYCNMSFHPHPCMSFRQCRSHYPLSPPQSTCRNALCKVLKET